MIRERVLIRPQNKYRLAIANHKGSNYYQDFFYKWLSVTKDCKSCFAINLPRPYSLTILPRLVRLIIRSLILGRRLLNGSTNTFETGQIKILEIFWYLQYFTSLWNELRPNNLFLHLIRRIIWNNYIHISYMVCPTKFYPCHN